MARKQVTAPQDKQAPRTGKVENDTNKMGKETPTQKNEGRRTPLSRSDRESRIGGSNQGKMRSAPGKAGRRG